MKAVKNFKAVLLVAALAMVLSPASAHRGYRHKCRHHARVLVVKPRPAVYKKLKFGKNERLSLAIAYLHNNKYLSVAHYSKITGLNRPMAEAELDAFAYDRHCPIVTTKDVKKKRYTLKV